MFLKGDDGVLINLLHTSIIQRGDAGEVLIDGVELKVSYDDLVHELTQRKMILDLPLVNNNDEFPAHTEITTQQILNAIYEEIGLENGEEENIDNLLIEDLLKDTETTIEDIVDRINNDFEVELDDGLIFSTTTIGELTQLINVERMKID